MANDLIKQLQDFAKTVNGDPQQIVMQMVQSGKVSQTDLNNAQIEARRISEMLRK